MIFSPDFGADRKWKEVCEQEEEETGKDSTMVDSKNVMNNDEQSLVTQPPECEGGNEESSRDVSYDDTTVHMENGTVLHAIPDILSKDQVRKPEWDEFVESFAMFEAMFRRASDGLRHMDCCWEQREERVKDMMSMMQDMAINHLHNHLARIKIRKEKEKWNRDQMVQCGAFAIMMGSYLVKMASMEEDDDQDRAANHHLMMLLQPDLETGATEEGRQDEDTSMDW